MPISKDLIAASSTPLVLSILCRSDSYGYALIKKVKRLSHEEINWTDGMLYPVLHRLEDQKLIESYWYRAETGRRRKYYKITETGKRELTAQKEQWRLVNKTLAELWHE